MAIGPGLRGFTFTEPTIKANAPSASGVYALYTSSQWVYFGETNDIQRRLLEHLKEIGTLIKRYGPTGFMFELQPANARVQRQNALILAYPTPCNQKLG